jgi:lambda family phage portal protein
MNLLDRAVAWISPERGIRRHYHRRMLEIVKRNYSAGDRGRRTDGWNVRPGQGPNSALAKSLPLMRERCRDLTRNNPWGASIVGEITANLIHYGIIPSFGEGGEVPELWTRWAESPQCDSAGRKDFYEIQRLVVRTWAESGECFVRRVWRPAWKPGEIPFALQVLESEFLDHSHDGTDNTKLGVKFDDSGSPLGYWIFPRHPGEALTANTSFFVGVDDMIHVYSEDRPGQIRGIPLMAPVVLRLYDLNLFEQFELQKQEIAAAFAGFRKKEEGYTPPTDDAGNVKKKMEPVNIDHIEPGAIEELEPNEDMVFSNPPQRSGYAEYVKQNLMAVAAGIGLTYESLSGDYGRVTFLNGRMGQLRFYRKIDQWQYMMLIPQFCRRVAAWFAEGAEMIGQGVPVPRDWQPPIHQMVDPEKEIKATIEAVRAGMMTPFEAIRGHGNDPIRFLDDYKAALEAIDERGLVFSTDVRKVSGNGQAQNSGDEDENGENEEEGVEETEKK